ncbi:hypothetical protein D3C84_1066020 [compost metagenome]
MVQNFSSGMVHTAFCGNIAGYRNSLASGCVNLGGKGVPFFNGPVQNSDLGSLAPQLLCHDGA